MKQTYKVSGMHCASCASIITKKVSKLDGVQSCEVHFGTQEATVEFDQSRIDLPQIDLEVAKYGYHMSHGGHTPSITNTETTTDTALSHAKRMVTISLPITIITVGIMVWMIGAEPAYQRWGGNDVIKEFFHHLLPIFATVMLFVVGQKYLTAIRRYIKYGVANMDTLVGIGTSVAFLYSFLLSAFEEYLRVQSQMNGSIDPTILGRGFYEAVIVVIGFIEVGKYLETRVMSKTGKAIKALIGLQVKQALVIRDGQEQLLPLEHVLLGDIMLVKPGEKIPLDGVIIKGSADIDESMVTGESLPVTKNIDDVVIGSTVVTNSTLQVKATALGADTFLSKIIALVAEAQNSKPPIQHLVDRIMTWFVPSVLLIAIGSAVFWLVRGKTFFPEINAIQYALMSFVGVLVIACPCGLGLATPMAIITGIGQGAKHGILAKNAEGLLKLRKTQFVVFDKTGTLTEGKPTVVDIHTVADDEKTCLSLLASLESLSSHPIAHAIVTYAKHKNTTLHEVKDFSNLAGIGIAGVIDDKKYSVSKPAHLDEQHIPYDKALIQTWTKQGKTPLVLHTEKTALCYVAVADTIKSSSKKALHQLALMGITPVMVTGDHTNTAHVIAQELGITRVYAEIRPEQKAEIISTLQKEGIVTMVGDGINDAPALAQADIGIAMSTGTDVAIESADITLLHGDLNKLITAYNISRLTNHAIRQNLARAFGFNLVGIPLAAGVFYPLLGTLLNPAFEGMAMAFSDLTVVGNTLRLQAKRL